MGWLPVLLAAGAAWLFGWAQYPILFSISVVAAVAAFWSWGVMHNHALEAGRKRIQLLVENMRLEGRSEAEIQIVEAQPIRLTPADTQAAPDSVTRINIVATLTSIIMLVWAVVVRF